MRSVAMMSLMQPGPQRGLVQPSSFYQQPDPSPKLQFVSNAHSKVHDGSRSITSSGSGPRTIAGLLLPPWTITEPLRFVPTTNNFRLERTHVVCGSDVTANVVTTRISTVLRNESIAATYDQDRVAGETKCGVRFVLRLWLLPADESSSSARIVVECQRVAGCGFVYCQTAKTLLRAAKNGLKTDSKKKNKTGRTEGPLSVPECIVKQAASAAVSSSAPLPRVRPIPRATEEEIAKDSVNHAAEMLLASVRDNRIDAQLLAMEILEQVSSPTTHPTTSLAVARSLLVAESPPSSSSSKCHSLCFETILSLITDDPSANDDDEDDRRRGSRAPNTGTALEQSFDKLLRRKALAIFANCLSTLESSGELRSVAMPLNGGDTDRLVHRLVPFVADAALHPHEASDACAIVRLLLLRTTTTSPSSDASASQRATAVKRGSSLAYHVDRATRLCGHVALEESSMKLLQELHQQ